MSEFVSGTTQQMRRSQSNKAINLVREQFYENIISIIEDNECN